MSGTAEAGRILFTVAADSSSFQAALAQARAEVNKFSSATTSQLGGMNQALDKSQKEVQALQSTVSKLTADNKQLRDTMQMIITELQRMQRGLQETGRSGEREFSRLEAVTKRVRQEITRVAVAYLGFQGLSALRNTITEFEDAQDRVSRFAGSAEAAQRVMNDLRNIFRGHGVDIRDAAKAYEDLVQSGMSPTNTSMQALGNIAATVGSDVAEVAKAFRSAVEGQFDPLRELGVRVQQTGNNIRLTFQGVTTTVRNTAAGLQQAMNAIGNGQLAGASAEATGLGAAFARLKAAADELVQSVGESGLTESFATLVNKFSELLPYITPLAQGIGTVLSFAFRTASAAIDLFIAGLDGIITGIRTIITLAETGSFTAAMGTLTQGMAQARADFERRQANPAGTATPPAFQGPTVVVGATRPTRTAVRRGGGGGGREDERLRELQSYMEKLQQEAAAAETSIYEAERARMQGLIDQMKAAGGALAQRATELETKINQVSQRRNDALAQRAIQDIREENDLLRIRLNLGENEAEVQQELLRLRRQGVTVTDAVINDLRREVDARRELEEELKNQQQRNAEIANGLSSAFGNAFQAMTEPGAKLSDILKQLERDLLNLATRVLVLKPLEEMLNSVLNGAPGKGGAGGGGLLGMLGGLLGGGGGGGVGEVAGAGMGALKSATTSAIPVFHNGTEGPPMFRNDNVAKYATAPRFNVGLAANEFRAILERGEVVLNQSQQKAVSAAAAGGDRYNIHFHGVTDMESFRRSEGQINSRLMSRVHRGRRVS
jgi:hypothetical protein